MTLRWLDEAKADADEIWDYIAEQSDSDERATAATLKIAATARMLTDHPLAGPAIDEDRTGRHRHLICYSYRIIDRVEDEVVIVAVIHGAHLLPAAILRRK